MDPLFPELPENLSELNDEELSNLLAEHEVAADLIDSEDEDFTKGLSADEILSQYEAGVEQIETIRGEQKARVEAQEQYLAAKAELATRRKSEEASDGEEEGEETQELTVESADLSTEISEDEGGDEGDDGDEDGDGEEAEPAPAVAALQQRQQRPLRRPPAPSLERQAQATQGSHLIAAPGHLDVRGGQVLDRTTLAKAMKVTAQRRGKPTKQQAGVEERILIASAQFPFPEERRLNSGDWEVNAQKIRDVVPLSVPGLYGNMALVASGGLCAPLEPIYTMPNFAVTDRPVRDALPSFQADRGGVNVPTATDIADITSAITVIEESEDALGGTFATKSCQDLTCPAYTEVAVTIISHCREYGNLNAMAWPEKIAHENDLTMAAHARTAENYLLDRVKALSINVTQAEILGAYGDLAHAVTKAAAGIRYRLRMTPGARFRVLLPAWVADALASDVAFTQFDRFQNQAQMTAHLESLGVSVTYYLDDVTGGTSQGFAAEAAGALDDFPDDIQWAIFPEGEFIHVDSGSLELGIVRDSTLNSTNDFQIFGETFENVARLGPAQGALWVTQGVCPNGEVAAAATALTC